MFVFLSRYIWSKEKKKRSVTLLSYFHEGIMLLLGQSQWGMIETKSGRLGRGDRSQSLWHFLHLVQLLIVLVACQA